MTKDGTGLVWCREKEEEGYKVVVDQRKDEMQIALFLLLWMQKSEQE